MLIFLEHVRVFTFKQEQSKYKNYNVKGCAVYADTPKVKCS